MKLAANLRVRWKNMIDTINRFPITILLLVAAAIVNAVNVNMQNKIIYTRFFVTFLLGASVYVVGQLIYERFLSNSSQRLMIMAASILFTFLYYFLIRRTNWGVEVSLRTSVIFFILLTAFLWIPVVKSRINFNQSFMAAFKGFFAALFFNGILFLGTALIIRAIDMLITRVNGNAYEHAANIVFIFLAPVYFLSLIPVYPNRGEERTAPKEYIDEAVDQAQESESINVIPDVGDGKEEVWMKAVSPARFLETLISYIVIPITAVFTIILLLYIILNISGKFWTNNLMEPLLLSYSITVIIVYLLASNLNNAIARYFRMIFPKLLVPVVLFQTIASVFKVNELGVTYGRYYVILYGVFAIIAGIIFCILPIQKNGLIAPILIILSLVSIVPPVDAFTISRINQTARLETTLKINGMLKDHAIVPKTNLSEKDQKIIISSVNYLDRMNYTKNISWLLTYHNSGDFKTAFGFTEYTADKNAYTSFYIERDAGQPIPIYGYEYMIFRNVNNFSEDFQSASFENKEKSYFIKLIRSSSDDPVIILTEGDNEIIRFETSEIFNKFSGENKTAVGTDEVTFTKKNNYAVMTVIAQSIGVNKSEIENNLNTDVYILVHIK